MARIVILQGQWKLLYSQWEVREKSEIFLFRWVATLTPVDVSCIAVDAESGLCYSHLEIPINQSIKINQSILFTNHLTYCWIYMYTYQVVRRRNKRFPFISSEEIIVAFPSLSAALLFHLQRWFEAGFRQQQAE